MKILKERDYTEAEWQGLLAQAKTQENMQILRPHFNGGDWLIVLSQGWKLEAATRPSWQYASTPRPQDFIVVLEDCDKSIDEKPSQVGYDVAFQIKALQDGTPYVYTVDAIKTVIKLAQKYGDSPLERKAKAAMEAHKSASFFA